MSSLPSYRFSAPTRSLAFSGLLFDNDGTLIDSTSVINAYWRRLAGEIGIDYETMINTAHGRRSIDTLKIVAPDRANWEYVKEQEAALPKNFGHLAKAIPGALELIQAADNAKLPWAIVTSATEGLLQGWLKVMNMARPTHVVTAESVANGKPDPSCYQLGAKKIGVDNAEKRSVLVFEDALSGIKAGKAAGYTVIALTTTHEIDDLKKAGPDYIIKDMTSVSLKQWDAKSGRGDIEIRNALIV